MKIFTNKNGGLILATLSSAIMGSMIQVITSNPTIQLVLFIVAIIGVIVGTALYERG